MSGVVYPVGLRLLDRRVVVVGGGSVAHRRVAGLLEARARVTVVSPEVTPALEALVEPGSMTWVRRRYVPGGARVRAALRERGWAVRRGDTFSGLVAEHLRVAVRDPGTSRAFAADLAAILGAEIPGPLPTTPSLPAAVPEEHR